MNVIISNKNEPMLQSLEIDVIKRLNGSFSADEIISQFQNFFFQRMILDITAIKDYKDITTLQKLSISLDMDKIILLLDGDEESSSPEYISKLISMGIYNFTQNVEGIMYLYNNPNSYRDVAHIHQLNQVSAAPETVVVERYAPVAQGCRVIGIKNVTKQSGATTLSYMMKNQLSHNYSVVAIEVGKNDFKFFNDRSLISVNENQIGTEVAKNNNKDVIIIDVNDSKQAESLCHDMIYLVEPSVIKLNKLMMVDRNAFNALKNKKVVLNQSLLSKKDVLDFEYESRSKVFYNMPPLDEREKDIFTLNAFLVRLGFTKQQTAEEQVKKNKLFGIFNNI